MVLNVDLNIVSLQEENMVQENMVQVNGEIDLTLSLGLPAFRLRHQPDTEVIVRRRGLFQQTVERYLLQGCLTDTELAAIIGGTLPSSALVNVAPIRVILPNRPVGMFPQPTDASGCQPDILQEPTDHRFNCPVCISPLMEETATKCGHIFCKTCIVTAINVQHKCPTCRKKLKLKDTIRIYLN